MEPRLRTYALVGAGLVLLLPAVRSLHPGSSGPFHTALEVAATAAALFAGVLSLVRYYARKSDEFLVLGAGLLGTAFLDGYHALVTSAFLAPSLPSSLPSLIPWSWLASRLVLGAVFLAVALLQRGVPLEPRPPRLSERSVFLAVGAVSALSFLVFALVPLPTAYFRGRTVGRPEEWLAGALFAAALFLQLRRGAWRASPFEHWTALALITACACQLAYMPFSYQLFDAAFDAAHALKIGTYACVLTGLLWSTSDAFRKAELTAQQLEREVAARTERLERSNRDLDDFAFVASHDLRAPLRDVDNLSKWIAEDVGDRLPPDSARHFAKIQDRVGRMERLLDDLLQYSRAGRKFGAPESIPLAELLHGVTALAAAPEGFEIHAASSVASLYSPRSALERVLVNLVVNAIKHHDRPRGNVWISVQEAGPLARFEVRDDGPGIESRYHARIFGMFQSLKREENSQSTGMGLAIVKRLVESHGGRIELESAPGAGSAFRFSWPLRWQASAEAEEKPFG